MVCQSDETIQIHHKSIHQPELRASNLGNALPLAVKVGWGCYSTLLKLIGMAILVGVFNLYEKYDRQFGSFPKNTGENRKYFETTT